MGTRLFALIAYDDKWTAVLDSFSQGPKLHLKALSEDYMHLVGRVHGLLRHVRSVRNVDSSLFQGSILFGLRAYSIQISQGTHVLLIETILYVDRTL